MTVPPRRPVPVPPGDDGSADPEVSAALAAHARGRLPWADVVAVLAGSRLLVPVVAVLDEVAEAADGTRTDTTSHMASVSTTGRDGRRGQLAFTSVEALRRWDPRARPVPVAARAAARAALDDGADALVVDLAGPVVVELDAPTLHALAAGWQPLHGGNGGLDWTVPVVLPAPAEGAAEHDAAAAVTARGRWWRRR